MKTEPVLTRFGGTFSILRFDEKYFFNTLLDFTPYWDYVPTNAIHADSPGVFTSENNVNLSTKFKIHIKCDCIDRLLVNGGRQPILLGFV